MTDRPGANLPEMDLEAAREKAAALLGTPATGRDAMSYLMYPRVFPDLAAHLRLYGDTSVLPTPMFFFGPAEGVENLVEIEPGKTLIVRLLAISEPTANGNRTVFFELNGQPREIVVKDRSLAGSVREAPKADPGDSLQIGSPLPGLVVGVGIHVGDAVRKGQKLLSIEAMKMETTLYAERPGRVAEVLAVRGATSQHGRAADSPTGLVTRPFVRTILEFDQLSSTSDKARELVEAGGIDLPILIVARTQLAGRGRSDHSWWSDEGSLTFTVAIDPHVHALRPEQESRVALAVAVAICRLVDAYADVSCGIRWPNDIETDGRKLGGILPERIETQEGPRLLIGVGLNVRTDFRPAPEEIRRMATSIAHRSWMSDEELPTNDEFLDGLLANIEQAIQSLAAEEAMLHDDWRHRDLLLGRYVRLKLGETIVTGIGAGISPDGGLRIRAVGGPTSTYHGGQVLRDPIIP